MEDDTPAFRPEKTGEVDERELNPEDLNLNAPMAAV